MSSPRRERKNALETALLNNSILGVKNMLNKVTLKETDDVVLYAKSLEALELLLKHGANLHVRDSFNRDAMFYATSSEMVRFLVLKGFDPNSRDKFENTPLHSAPNSDVVHSLVAYGADPNSKNIYGDTPLFRKYIKENVAYALILSGTDPYIRNNVGLTAYQVVKNSRHVLAGLNTKIMENCIKLYEIINSDKYRLIKDHPWMDRKSVFSTVSKYLD
jgi:ankyrin repeat protein